jgi:hypothetical protein
MAQKRKRRAGDRKAERKHTARIVKSPSRRYSRLNARERATRQRADALLSDLRRRKGSYSHLLRKYHLDTRTAHKYLGKDLHGGTGGERVRPSKADRRVRDVMFPTSFGDLPRRTRSSRNATKLSAFFHDRDRLLRGKLSADDFEATWWGVRIAGEELFADAAAIVRMANAGFLKLENLYASTGAAR